jgi:hypothetical protein
MPFEFIGRNVSWASLQDADIVLSDYGLAQDHIDLLRSNGVEVELARNRVAGTEVPGWSSPARAKLIVFRLSQFKMRIVCPLDPR